MPSRACRTAFLTFFLVSAGCAALSGDGLRGGLERQRIIDAVLHVGVVGEALIAEAEATITFAGRSVSLPAAFLAREDGEFRIDLLDPLDRPVAMIFGKSERIIQYQPAAAAAAALRPYPESCGELGAGVWVRGILGRYAQPESWRVQSLFGKVSLVRHRSGDPVQRIALRQDEDRWLPKSVTWYCNGDPALLLEILEHRSVEDGTVPVRFRVSFTAARLKMDIRLDRVVTGRVPEPQVLQPELPPGTGWKSWRLVWEER